MIDCWRSMKLDGDREWHSVETFQVNLHLLDSLIFAKLQRATLLLSYYLFQDITKRISIFNLECSELLTFTFFYFMMLFVHMSSYLFLLQTSPIPAYTPSVLCHICLQANTRHPYVRGFSPFILLYYICHRTQGFL